MDECDVPMQRVGWSKEGWMQNKAAEGVAGWSGMDKGWKGEMWKKQKKCWTNHLDKTKKRGQGSKPMQIIFICEQLPRPKSPPGLPRLSWVSTTQIHGSRHNQVSWALSYIRQTRVRQGTFAIWQQWFVLCRVCSLVFRDACILDVPAQVRHEHRWVQRTSKLKKSSPHSGIRHYVQLADNQGKQEVHQPR